MSMHILKLTRASEISSARTVSSVGTADISQLSLRNRIFGVTTKLCDNLAQQFSKLVRIRHRQQNGLSKARVNRAARRRQAREARHAAMASSGRPAMPKLRQITRKLSAPTGAAGLIFAASIGGTTGAQAQSFVNVCSGLSVNLPVLQPVTSGLNTLINTLLPGVGTLLGTNFDLLSGKNIGLSVLDTSGKLVSTNNCAVSGTGVQVTTNQGISLGGGQITGLGGTNNTVATASDPSAIAIGNGATTSAGALNAIALGTTASATTSGGIAIGNGASSTFANSIAIGTGTKAPGSAVAQGVIDFRTAGNPNQQVVNAAAGTLTMTPSAVAVGENSVVNTGGGLALGYNNNAGSTNGFFSTAIGANNLASGGYSSAIGVNNTATGSSSVALGVNNTATGIRSIAIGRQALTASDYGIAQGFVASSYGLDSIAIGKNSVAGVSGGTVTDDVALGPNASATAGNSVALGSNSTATRAGLGGAGEAFSQTAVASTNGAVSVGLAGGERQITNVAGGTQATDAVNLRQLSSVANNVATTLGSAFDPTTGAYTAPGYKVGANTYTTVPDAIAALNATVGSSTTFVSNNAAAKAAASATGPNASAGGYGSSATGNASTVVGNSATDNGNANATVLGNGASVSAGLTGSNVALGQGSTVTANAVATPNAVIGGNTVTFAGGAPAGTVSVGTAAAPRTITNVAAGRLSTTSTDAVNGSQLNATNQQVNTNTTNITNINNGTVGTVQRTGTAGQLALTAPGGTGAAPGAVQNLINVGPGALNASSTDAVNGSQLNTTNANVTAVTAQTTALGNSVAADLGGGSTYTVGGGLTAPSYNTFGTTAANVGAAITNLQTLAPVQYSNAAGTATPQTRSNDMALVGAAAGPVTLHNLAAGTANTDAVNVGQLTTAIGNGPFASNRPAGAANPVASGAAATAGGYGSSATGAASTALGNNATDNAVANSTVLGNGATVAAGATGTNVALGQGSTVAGTAVGTPNAVIGGTAYTFAGGTPAGTVSVGAAGAERTVTNVAAGRLSATSTDAVNGSQLFATNAAIDTINAGAAGTVQRTGNPNELALVAAGQTGAAPGAAQTLTNVANGSVTATSNQGINGSQLFGTAQSVATSLGGGSTVGANGAVTAPTYNVVGGSYNNVGSALTALDNGLSTGKLGAFVSDNNAGAAASSAGGKNASAGGFGAVAQGDNSTAVGNSAVDNGVANSTVLGNGASVTAGLTGSNVALGQGSVVTTGAVNGYTAFGIATPQNSAGTVSVGSVGAERIASNVAAGRLGTDAVNVNQLAGVASNLGGSVATSLGGGTSYDATTGKLTGGFTVNGTTYSDVASAVSATAASGGVVQRTATPNQVAIIAAGASGTAPGAAQNLTNLAAGAVGATSTDAVNGSQLYGTAQSVSTALGGGSKVNPDGTIAGPTYNVAGGSYTNVGSALSALDNGISSGKLGAFVADNTAGNANAAATGTNASAGGFGAVASGAGSTSIGNSAVDNGVANSTVLGSGASIVAGLTGSNVALGQGSVASTGAQTNYSAFGLTAPQSSVGTVSVGSAGAERTISNVAAGTAGTDAVNVNQLSGATSTLGGSIAMSLGGGATYNSTTGAITGPTYTVGGKTYGDVGSAIAAGNALSVQYTTDGAGNPTNAIDLTKGGTLAPVTVSGVGAGTLSATSKDAVNGSQLYATNQAITSIIGSKGGAFVSDNTSGAAIPAATGADSSVGGFGAVASGARSTALGNGSSSSGTNSVALGAGSTDGGVANVVSVGSAGNERRITNVAAGVNATDAANMGQLTALSARSLQYDTTATGDTNYQSVTLNPTGSGPVTIHNVAAGTALTDAVNVGQLNAASANSVQYSTNPDGTRSNTLALLGGTAGTPVTVSNVAAGVAPTDAVNVGQLQSALSNQYNNLAQITEYQFRSAKMAAYAGTSIALATAGIRFDDRPGKISLGIGASGYHGSAGLAIGLGGTSEDGKWRINVSAGFSPNNQKGAAGVMGGASYTFN